MAASSAGCLFLGSVCINGSTAGGCSTLCCRALTLARQRMPALICPDSGQASCHPHPFPPSNEELVSGGLTGGCADDAAELALLPTVGGVLQWVQTSRKAGRQGWHAGLSVDSNSSSSSSTALCCAVLTASSQRLPCLPMPMPPTSLSRPMQEQRRGEQPPLHRGALQGAGQGGAQAAACGPSLCCLAVLCCAALRCCLPSIEYGLF